MRCFCCKSQKNNEHHLLSGLDYCIHTTGYTDNPNGSLRLLQKSQFVMTILSSMLTKELTVQLENFQGYIPPGIVFVLHWQLRPTQGKCTSNANYSTYILYGFLIIIRYVCANTFQNVYFWRVKTLFEMFHKQYLLRYMPQRNQNRLVEYRL